MAVDIVEILDHEARAEARLATQFMQSERLKGLLRCFTEQVAQIESMLFGVMLGLRLENATGANLDLVGRVIGLDRESADDSTYRVRLTAQRLSLKSTGSAESILSVFSTLLPPPDHTLALLARYPASLILNVFGETDPALTPLYARFLDNTHAAGVGAQGVLTVAPDAETFTFSEIGDPDDIDLGFGNNAQTTGGHLAGVF